MAMPDTRARRWSAREVRRLIADAPRATPRYELVSGELLVTPSPGPAHQEAVALLLTALRRYCESERAFHALASPADVELEPDDVRQPDLFVMPIAEWRRVLRVGFPATRLALAVEVLSPGSERHDRVSKRPGYQRHVVEYWIVDVEAGLVERWTKGEDRPEIVTGCVEWHPAEAVVPFRLDLEQFFRSAQGK